MHKKYFITGTEDCTHTALMIVTVYSTPCRLVMGYKATFPLMKASAENDEIKLNRTLTMISQKVLSACRITMHTCHLYPCFID